jgi:predicted dehydrogenase
VKDVMTDTIGWGILATGGIAASFTQDLALLPDARVAAVGSRTTAAAKDFADRFDIPRHYGDWDGLIADPDVDIVYIANTNNGHYEAARRCLAGGKAVLCEKPFTLNHHEAQTLVDMATERGLFLMEAMWMRCNPAILRMMDEIRDGVIGEVTSVMSHFGLSGPFPLGHRLRDPKLGGGALLDLGVYPVTLAQLVLGRPDRVAATASLTPEGVDATCGVLHGYDSRPAVANLTCSQESDSAVTAVIAGPKGRIELSGPFYAPRQYTFRHGDRERTVEQPYLGNGMVHEAVEAMRCLRAGLRESPLLPWADTLDVMATMDEIRRQIGVVFPTETLAG